MKKYSLDWLQSQEEGSHKFFFFWGHTQKQPDKIDRSCFSQWYPSAFTVNGDVYRTAEHWMMAQKALLFRDESSFKQIMLADKPGAAKALGREVQYFNLPVWEAYAYDLVVEGNYHKFSQHADLKEFLLKTGDQVIVEASPVDAIWGIGLAQDDAAAQHPSQWKGTNLLGFALMEVRDKLK